MNKPYRLIKRRLALVLVLLFSIESFAAVVGDNDGAAFITKAEFDSMKNDFQSQLDRYNSSLDNKIDGAIASYLSGVQVTKKQELACPIKNYSDMKWVNDLWLWSGLKQWAPGSTTELEKNETRAWRRVGWGHYRNMRGDGVDLISWWEGANGPRAVAWDLHVFPKSDQHIGQSDYLSNRTDRLSIPVLVLNLPKETGYNVIKENDKHIFLEAMCEIYGQLNPRWEEGYDYHCEDGRTTGIYQLLENLWTSQLGKVKVNCDDNYWLKLDVPLVFGKGNIYTDSTHTAFHATWSDINSVYKWYITQNFDAKAGTFAQPADNFIKAARDTRNYGYRWILDWFNDGGDNTQIVNNRRNNFRTTWNLAYRLDWVSFEQILDDFMLGRDSDQVCNIGYEKEQDEYSGSTFRYDWTHSEWPTVNSSYWFQTFPLGTLADRKGEWPLEGNDTYRYISYSESPAVDGQIKWPLWPQATISELMHNQYKLNTVPLKAGQGLPLVTEVSANGVVKIKLKYEVKDRGHDSMWSPPTPSQKVNIFIKNKDFTTNHTNDYYTNNKTSTTNAGSLNGYELETNDEVEFSIDVKKGDSLWLRIAPYDTTPSGTYAQISKISMQLETD